MGGDIFSFALSISYKLEVWCEGLIRFRLNIFGKNTFRMICRLHIVSHQKAHNVRCLIFNNSEFDHLINGASCYFYLDIKLFTLHYASGLRGFISVQTSSRNPKLFHIPGLFWHFFLTHFLQSSFFSPFSIWAWFPNQPSTFLHHPSSSWNSTPWSFLEFKYIDHSSGRVPNPKFTAKLVECAIETRTISAKFVLYMTSHSNKYKYLLITLWH